MASSFETPLFPIVQTINEYLSNYVLVILLLGVGIWYTIKTRCVQVRCFKEGWNRVFGNITLNGKKGGGGSDAEEDAGSDPMFKQAVDVVIDAGQASTSLLQRRCKLGYARAARIMDEMEQKSIIGPYEGAKPRAVLISRQQWLEMQMNQPEE